MINIPNKYYVYAYYRLDNNTIFYIGKGSGKRWCNLHRGEHFNRIINKCDVVVEILYDNLTEQEAFELERLTIEDLVFNEGYGISINGYMTKDTYLINRTWGGEGSSGNNPYLNKSEDELIAWRNKIRNSVIKSYINQSSEYKLNRSIRVLGEKNPMYKKGYLLSGDKNGMYGKKHSKETKLKIRNKALGRTGESNGRFKSAIIREDLHGGNITRYVGYNEIVKDGFNDTMVYNCCNGKDNKHRHKDYIFYWEGDIDRRNELLELNKNQFTSAQIKYRRDRTYELINLGLNDQLISNILSAELNMNVTVNMVSKDRWNLKNKNIR